MSHRKHFNGALGKFLWKILHNCALAVQFIPSSEKINKTVKSMSTIDLLAAISNTFIPGPNKFTVFRF